MAIRENTKKKIYEIDFDIQVQLNRDAETVTVRFNPEANDENIPDVRFVFSESQLRGMLKLLEPSNEDDWRQLYDIAVY